jgi:hypothetical protein
MHRPLFAGCFGDCEPTSVEDANVRYGSLADISRCERPYPLSTQRQTFCGAIEIVSYVPIADIWG